MKKRFIIFAKNLYKQGVRFYNGRSDQKAIAKRMIKVVRLCKIYNPTQARSRYNSNAAVHNMREYRM